MQILKNLTTVLRLPDEKWKRGIIFLNAVMIMATILGVVWLWMQVPETYQ
jgi:hypothetical protein